MNPHYDLIDKKLRNDEDIIEIGVLNTSINYLDYGSKKEPNLILEKGRFKTIKNKQIIKEKRITIVAGLKEEITTNAIKIKLSPEYYYEDNKNRIKNLTIVIDNVSHSLINNYKRNTEVFEQTVSVSNKIINLNFNIEYADKTEEIITSTIKFNGINTTNSLNRSTLTSCFEKDFVGNNGIATTSPENTIPFQGYNETTATKGTLEYRTYYNQVTNTCGMPMKINKPIIILDGYDPGDGRKIYPGSAGYDQSKRSLYELMTYDHDNNPSTYPINLVDQLTSPNQGFDVTLVNFPTGADYIERNAMALVALLKREKAKLIANGSNEQIILIGPNMGGLISRYALAYMEKNNIPHNVKLWVSFDSPHLGANIPIAAQETLYFFGYDGQSEQAKLKFHENFGSPAARQMLIEQLDYKHQNYNWNQDPNLWYGGNGQNNNIPFRNQFNSNLTNNGLPQSNGFPLNLRKIALVNGTTNGRKTWYEGVKFLEMEAFKRVLGIELKVASIEDRFLANTNNSIQTFRGRVSIPSFLSLTIIDRWVNRINMNSRGSMDAVQGGTFDTQGIIKEEFTPKLNEDASYHSWNTYLKNHSFIPSVSALAFKNADFNWALPIDRNLACNPTNKEIYFDSYFSPKNNEEHVFLTKESVDWLLKEINNQPQTPWFDVSESTLQGLSHLCENQTTNFSFQNDVCKLPSLVQSWGVNENLQIISSNSLGITVKGIGNGQGTITATFSNGMKVIKTIWVGKPIIDLPEDCWLDEPTTPNCFSICRQMEQTINNFVFVEAKGTDQASLQSGSWEWQKITNNFTLTPYDNSAYLNPLLNSTPQSYLGYKVRVKNVCGWSDWFENYLDIIDCEYGGLENFRTTQEYFVVYPNPVKDVINIELRDKQNIPITVTQIKGELFDIMGISKANLKFTDIHAFVNVNNLKDGVYLLKIYLDDKIENHHIIINSR